MAELILGCIQCGGEHPCLVLRLDIEISCRKIAFSHTVGENDSSLKRPGYYNRDQKDDENNHQRPYNSDYQHPVSHTCHLGGDIIDINPAAENPSPWFVKLNERDFRCGFGITRLRPHVIDEPLTFVPAYVHHLDKQLLAVWIFVITQILAVKFGFDGMHQHLGLHVVDPDVIVVLVTETTNPRERPFLGFLNAKFSLLGPRVIFGNQCVGDINYASRGRPLLINHFGLHHGKEIEQHAENEEEYSEDRNADNLCSDSPILESDRCHDAPLPAGTLLIKSPCPP